MLLVYGWPVRKVIPAIFRRIVDHQPLRLIHLHPAILLAPAEVRLLHDLRFLTCLRRRLPVRYRYFDLVQRPRRQKNEDIYVMERTFKVSWIQDTDLIATTLLNEPGLKSTVQW